MRRRDWRGAAEGRGHRAGDTGKKGGDWSADDLEGGAD